MKGLVTKVQVGFRKDNHEGWGKCHRAGCHSGESLLVLGLRVWGREQLLEGAPGELCGEGPQ